MPRPRKWPPTIHRHHTGQAFVRIASRDYYLGPYGSAQAQEAYLRLLAECRNGQPPPAVSGQSPGSLTVAELAARYLEHLDRLPKPGGDSRTNEARETAYALKPLTDRYGSTPAAEFGARALKAVREVMRQAGLSLGVVNLRIARIKRCWRWAAEEELLPGECWHALQAVRRLPQPSARPKPVPQAIVELTLPELGQVLADMVRVQMLTGMRPGEVVRVRAEDLDRTGDVWIYRPAHHKTSYKGIDRVILIGPKAQAVLAPYLASPPGDYLFRPERRGGARYTTGSYAYAVRRACARANVKHWSPHQLRHAAATVFRAVGGLDGAQALLGHQRSETTQIYADLPAGAVDVIRRVG